MTPSIYPDDRLATASWPLCGPLRDQVAEINGRLEEAEDFALAGGAVLIVLGVIDRQTRDLDFFGLSVTAVDRLVPGSERALREAGLDVQRVVSPWGAVVAGCSSI